MSGNKYTIEQEVQIGREGMAEVERKLTLAALGQRLADKAPGYKFPYTFKVIRLPASHPMSKYIAEID